MPPKKLRHFGTISSGPNRSSCKKWCAKLFFCRASKTGLATANATRKECLQMGPLQKVLCKLFFCRGVKNRSSNSNATRGNAGTRNVANGSVLKDQKKYRRGPGASPYVHEGVHPVKCNARFWNRQPHLWMPQLCIARNFLFRRGGDASQKTPPLWYDLFRSKPVFLQKVVCKLFFCRAGQTPV